MQGTELGLETSVVLTKKIIIQTYNPAFSLIHSSYHQTYVSRKQNFIALGYIVILTLPLMEGS